MFVKVTGSRSFENLATEHGFSADDAHAAAEALKTLFQVGALEDGQRGGAARPARAQPARRR